MTLKNDETRHISQASTSTTGGNGATWLALGSPVGTVSGQKCTNKNDIKMTYLFQFFQFVKTQILHFLFFLSFCWNYTIYQITFSDVSFNGTIFRP